MDQRDPTLSRVPGIAMPTAGAYLLELGNGGREVARTDSSVASIISTDDCMELLHLPEFDMMRLYLHVIVEELTDRYHAVYPEHSLPCTNGSEEVQVAPAGAKNNGLHK